MRFASVLSARVGTAGKSLRPKSVTYVRWRRSRDSTFLSLREAFVGTCWLAAEKTLKTNKGLSFCRISTGGFYCLIRAFSVARCIKHRRRDTQRSNRVFQPTGLTLRTARPRCCLSGASKIENCRRHGSELQLVHWQRVTRGPEQILKREHIWRDGTRSCTFSRAVLTCI